MVCGRTGFCHRCSGAVCRDGFSDSLCSARLGCCVGGKYVGRIMYADDVITLSVSLNMLQRMLTRSQAVARIADRTASQDSSNYNDCVIRPSIL